MTYAGVNSPYDLEKPGALAEKDDRTTALVTVSTSSYDDERLKQQRHFDHDGPIESVIRQRKHKTLNRGRQQQRGTTDSSAEQGVADADILPESSEDECKAEIIGNNAKYLDKAEELKEEHNARCKTEIIGNNAKYLDKPEELK